MTTTIPPSPSRPAPHPSPSAAPAGGPGRDPGPGRPPPREPVAVRLRGLTKRFGGHTAVADLDVDIPYGVTAGFVGPNGAGKTTTLRMLLGLVAPTAGTGTVLGRPLGRPAAYLGDVGALIEGPAFYPALSGRRNLAVVAAAGGHDPSAIPRLLEEVGLDGRGDDPFGRYSLGMKQRLGIAAALLGDPALLILDEPINGLDPAGIREMRELIGRLGRPDRTVFVSSHVLAELEATCDWLVVIDHGARVFEGPARQLADDSTAAVVVAPEHPGDLLRLEGALGGRGWAVERRDGRLRLAAGPAEPAASGHPGRFAAEVNRAAMEAGVVLAELSPLRNKLEDRYLTMVTGGDR